jgi:protein SCO1/2
MKDNLIKYIAIVGIILIILSLIIIITKTPKPKPRPGSIDIIEKANINPNEFGGDFILIDQNGNKFDTVNMRGKYQLIYFGFTSCPDICPASIIEISKAIERLNNQYGINNIIPMFVTIDPKRDNVTQLKAYFENIDPNIIALTGNEQEVNQVAKKFRVYYSIAEGADKVKNDYMINHSSFFYLVGPDGKFIKHYVPGAKGEEIAHDVAKVNRNTK